MESQNFRPLMSLWITYLAQKLHNIVTEIVIIILYGRILIDLYDQSINY